MRHLSAFTLIESLLVLLICCLFLLIPTLTISGWQRQVETEQFLNQFEKQVEAIQQTAIIRGKRTNIDYYANERQFVFSFTEGVQTHYDAKLTVPETLVSKGAIKVFFEANTGNNSELKQITFVWNERKLRIVYQFQLGSGKFVKKEEAI